MNESTDSEQVAGEQLASEQKASDKTASEETAQAAATEQGSQALQPAQQDVTSLEALSEQQQHINLENVVQALLLAADEPLSTSQLVSLVNGPDGHDRWLGVVAARDIRSAIKSLAEQAAGSGVALNEVASGWRYQVPEHYADWVRRLSAERPPRYSRALLETLAIISYRQPVTRGEIEEIRGVSVSSNIAKTLLERGWIKVVGQRDVPGRPALYGTTKAYLDYFNLKSLDELPALSELKSLDEYNVPLDLSDANAQPLAVALEQVLSNKAKATEVDAAEAAEEPPADAEDSASNASD